MKKYTPLVFAFLLFLCSCKDVEVEKETVFLNPTDLTGKLKSISYAHSQSEIKYNYHYKEALLDEVEVVDLADETRKTIRPEFNADSVIIELTSDAKSHRFSYNENAQLKEIIEQTVTDGEVISTFIRSIDGKLERFERFSIDKINSRKTTLLRMDLSWEAGSLKSYAKQGLGIEKDEISIRSENRESKTIATCLRHGVFLPLLPFLIPQSVLEERPLFSNSFYQYTESFDEFGNPTQLIITDVSTNTELLNLTLEYH